MVGLLHIAAVSLVIAGAAKIRNPAPTEAALGDAGLPSGQIGVLALGGAEVVLGLIVLVIGGPVAAGTLAAVYAGFAGFIMVALRRQGDRARCGCFGDTNAPPTHLHVVINLVIATTAAVLAAVSSPPLTEVLAAQAGAGVPYVVLLALGTAALFLILDGLPRLQSAMEGPTQVGP